MYLFCDLKKIISQHFVKFFLKEKYNNDKEKVYKNYDEIEICFVIAWQNRGYILDRIAKEIGGAFKGAVYYYTDEKKLPKAKKYFITHYSLIDVILDSDFWQKSRIYCFFTHDKGHLADYVQSLKKCDAIIAENQEGVDVVASYGIDKSKLFFVPECADPKQFLAKDRIDNRSVLICGTNYEDGRKNPELIKKIIELLPNKKFIFLGKNWESFTNFKNVEILQVSYQDYPSIYHQCSVYLSCSKLEGGGPNSLIEAMHANLVPVVSDTGNSRDYINNGKNGFIFTANNGADEVVKLINNAYEIKENISQTVSNFTWQYYAKQFYDIINFRSKNIFIRSFNPYINSKSGAKLADGEVRGTPEWKVFEKIMIDVLKDIGYNIFEQLESPIEADKIPTLADGSEAEMYKKIAVHKCKRDLSDYDLFYMQMHMRNLFTLNDNGWGADNSCNNLFDASKISDNLAKSFCEELSLKMFNSGDSKCYQPNSTDETPSNFIFVPIQTPRDYVIKNHSPIEVVDFIKQIAKWAKESQTYVCFKLHPFNKNDADIMRAVDDGVKASPYVLKIDGNINHLIKRSKGLFVINSGTGFESLIHGRPVATFGNCDYKKASFSANIKNLDAAKKFIYEYQKGQIINGYKFVYWYCNRHAYNVYNEQDAKNRLKEYFLKNHEC